MNHAKKMVLISPEALQRFNTPIRDDTINVLDSDMTDVLYSPKIEDREKWAHYQRMLQKRQHFLDQLRQPTQLPIIETPTMKDYNENLKEEILRTLPKAFRTKGELLFKRLCDSELVTWDKYGTVSINNNVLDGSNITDLVSDVIRCKKSGSPTGWKEFLNALSTINVPQELIGNPQRRAVATSSPRPALPSLRRRRTITPGRPVVRRTSWGHVRLN